MLYNVLILVQPVFKMDTVGNLMDVNNDFLDAKKKKVNRPACGVRLKLRSRSGAKFLNHGL
jgi:hypothetical protein